MIGGAWEGEGEERGVRGRAGGEAWVKEEFGRKGGNRGEEMREEKTQEME